MFFWFVFMSLLSVAHTEELQCQNSGTQTTDAIMLLQAHMKLVEKMEEPPAPALCPPFYHPITENLDGAGKEWAQPLTSLNRTIQQCADICNKRKGCTGFEYANGPSRHGGCGTYTAGSRNIKNDEGRLNPTSNWYSCMKDDICPPFYHPIAENLDGAGKEWAQPLTSLTRTIQQCADLCNKRRGCTGFEYANGPSRHGGCGTYTDGSRNIKKDEGRLNPTSNWYSCVQDDLCPAGYHPITENLDGAGKKWAQPMTSLTRTIQQCADICNKRRGCTGFEYANGPSRHGGCGTYTAGSRNIKNDEGRLNPTSNWYSCMQDDLCPAGYHPITENLDGAGKKWAQPITSLTRTIQQCADICNKRRGCTGFEYANGPSRHGGCGTYTAGSRNIKNDEGRLNPTSNWYSCMKD